MTDKDAAKLLYMEGTTQTRIAELLKVTEKTVSQWKISGRWAEQRENLAMYEQTSIEMMHRLIHHQMKIIDQKITDQEESGELEAISTKDIDALTKAFACVRNTQITWSAYVKTVRELLDYLHSRNLELSKQLLPFADDFLNLKRKDQ
jgi:predicted transcriptional regulator